MTRPDVVERHSVDQTSFPEQPYLLWLYPQAACLYHATCGFFRALLEGGSDGKDDAVEYPKASRGKFFAHKFVRLLMKSCAAQDIGQNAVLLCVFIAHTEDAMHYSGACRFWNEQLLSVMGFRSAKQLDTARDKAVASGWLVYDRAGNRSVGRYWVTIPEQFSELSDSPMGENAGAATANHSAIHSTNHSAIHSEFDPNSARMGNDLRNESGTNQGAYSIPVPNPSPSPVPVGADAERPTGKIGGGHEQVIIPECLNDPECRHVAQTWFRYLEEKDLGDRNPENSATQLQEWWQQMGRKGREKFLRDVRGSIQHGWKTIRDVDDTRTSTGGQVRSAQPDIDPDFLRAVAVCKEFPSGSDYDREKRESALGPLIRVVRKMTSARLAECDKFTQKQLAAEWTINREALR